jgi:peptidoglycan/LPS O-acetylase OafA/YrhL
LLAAAACLWRARRDRAALGWRATALALLLWAGGMAFNMIDALGAGRADFTPRASLFLYVLYGVPLVFILAGRAGNGQHQPDRCGHGGAAGRAVLRARAVVRRPR